MQYEVCVSYNLVAYTMSASLYRPTFIKMSTVHKVCVLFKINNSHCLIRENMSRCPQQHVSMDIHAPCLCLCTNILVSFMGVFFVVAYEPHLHRRLFLIVGPVDAGENWMCNVCVEEC